MRWNGILVASLVMGCGPRSDGMDGPSETGGETSAVSSESGAGSVTMPMLDGGSTTSADESSTTVPPDEPVLDIGVSEPGHCGAGEMDVQLEIVTPSGTFAPTHAWWGWNYCCFTYPRLVVAEVGELDVSDPWSASVDPSLEVWLDPLEDADAPFSGERPATLRAYVDADSSELAAPVALLSPIDPLQPAEAQTFAASVDVTARGWTVTGTVTAPYCPALDVPFCPCE